MVRDWRFSYDTTCAMQTVADVQTQPFLFSAFTMQPVWLL